VHVIFYFILINRIQGSIFFHFQMSLLSLVWNRFSQNIDHWTPNCLLR